MRWRFPSGKRLEEERQVAAQLRRSSGFYRFLWEVRAELFDAAFQDELVQAYAPRGQEPCPPALLAMVNLLQRYEGLSDADAVDAAENDRRWQLVLGCLGAPRAPFGQGSLVRFRVRLIAHELDKRLVDRTVELAKRTQKFGWQRLRVALDSSPLRGAGRVEDTWNLIGRAMSKVVNALSVALGMKAERIVEAAGLSVLEAPSVKAALDIDWTDPHEQHEALQGLLREVEKLEAWVLAHAPAHVARPPLSEALTLLRRVVGQDLEPDPQGGGSRIRQGVARDRLPSVGDTEMRHGRKSRSTRFDGYRRHVATAHRLILGTAAQAANQREYAPTGRLLQDVRRHGRLSTLDIDRGYLAADEIPALRAQGVVIHCRPWRVENGGLFTKEDFDIDLAQGAITCPGRVTMPIPQHRLVYFPEKRCRRCPLKARCTEGRFRSVRLHPQEEMLLELRAAQKTAEGRAQLRKRVQVEHRLARIDTLQSPKARYKGARKNELDLNRAAAVVNLQEVARLRRLQARRAA